VGRDAEYLRGVAAVAVATALARGRAMRLVLIIAA
jgi:hypothetical protein